MGKVIGKRGVVWEHLIPWMIGMVILVLGLVLYLAVSGKGEGMLNYLADLFNFGRLK